MCRQLITPLLLLQKTALPVRCKKYIFEYVWKSEKKNYIFVLLILSQNAMAFLPDAADSGFFF